MVHVFICIVKGTDVRVMTWSNIIEETGEPRENHHP